MQGLWLKRQVNALAPFLGLFWKQLSRNPINYFRGLYLFFRDLFAYRVRARGMTAFPLTARFLYPHLFDRFSVAGEVPRHYFFMDLWAARRVWQAGATTHLDIGSRVDGFIAHCLAFCKVVMVDVRPLPINVDGLSFVQCDCRDMRVIPDGSVESVSSLHALEHIGLGRYGDPIDPLGYEKTCREISRILAPNGHLYIGVPVGFERLEFNAHRVFSYPSVLALFADLELKEFSLIDDEECLIENASPALVAESFYACGLFHFIKLTWKH